MAINIEAANMAGYNNPKIEVFKVIMDTTTHIISDAPNKQEIIRCLRRGSIPALMVISPDGSSANFLWVYGCDYTDGELIAFGDPTYQLLYITGSEQPVFNS